MKSALILGGTRFFGKKLVWQLLRQGVEVTIATRGLSKDPFGTEVDRVIVDRMERDSMSAALRHGQWDVVFDQSCFSPEEARDAFECLRGRIGRYVFTSTVAVYDRGLNHQETDFNPLAYPVRFHSRMHYQGVSGYQEAKRASEAYLFQSADVPVVAARFPVVVGEDDPTERLRFHVNLVANRQPIHVPDVYERVGFIAADEAAGFLLAMGTNDFSGAINPGCRESLSLLEVIELIEECCDAKAELTGHPADPVSPYAMFSELTANTDKAGELGFEFADVRELLNRLVRYYLGNQALKRVSGVG
ncbi:MAG: NAD-dependent epimerase/dehydratase family protein [Aquisalimonadaceae bacterium]